MGQSLLFGSVASAALVLGALIGSQVTLPEHVYALLLGFAGGALISALAFELFSDAERHGGVRLAAIGPATADRLRDFHLEPDLVPAAFDSEHLAADLLPVAAGKRVLLARAGGVRSGPRPGRRPGRRPRRRR